nr:hypothetical protein [Pseudomonas syringae pv. actinidiae]
MLVFAATFCGCLTGALDLLSDFDLVLELATSDCYQIEKAYRAVGLMAGPDPGDKSPYSGPA